jgi:hypothetical protein
MRHFRDATHHRNQVMRRSNQVMTHSSDVMTRKHEVMVITSQTACNDLFATCNVIITELYS